MADRPRPGRAQDPGGRSGRDRTQRRGPRQRSAQRPAKRAKTADPAREVAYQTLAAVTGGAYANLELPRQLRSSGVSGRDAAFATELCYGTVRMQGLYDAVIGAAGDRPVDEIDPPVLDVLRLGCHQLLGMRVPDHAAVSATVALARQHVGAGAGGFVNAVLRRVSEADRDAWLDRVTASVPDELDRLALVESHPGWIVRALRAALLGNGTATPDDVSDTLADLLHAHNVPGPLTLVERPGLGGEDDLRAAGATPAPTAPTAWTLSGGDPGHLAAVRDGRAAVQDAGSQLVALALATAPVDGPDTQWLDLCAGPGGKAGLLAAVAAERGARLRANEVTPHRADLVRNTLAAVRAAGGEVEVTVEDGRAVGVQQPGRYDRVLVDAPCTGLGALRRRPEARWRRSPQDLTTLGPLQRELLGSALEATRPGGVVVYATCSPHLAETHFVVNDTIKKREDVVLEDVRPLVVGRSGEPLAGTGAGPWAQLWSQRHDTDSMFLALLRKR